MVDIPQAARPVADDCPGLVVWNHFCGYFSAVVWGPHHHRDHFLAPLLGLSSSHEPYLLVFRLRLADLRRALHRGRDAVCACWNAALGLSSSSGPLHYLHKFLRIVGIQPHPDVCVQFTDGSSLDLGYADRTCILRKVEQAWFLYAADKVSGKIGLEDVAATDLCAPLGLFYHQCCHVHAAESQVLEHSC